MVLVLGNAAVLGVRKAVDKDNVLLKPWSSEAMVLLGNAAVLGVRKAVNKDNVLLNRRSAYSAETEGKSIRATIIPEYALSDTEPGNYNTSTS